MQTLPNQLQLESSLLFQRATLSAARRARAAGSSASFDQVLRKNRQPEQQLERPQERDEEADVSFSGKSEETEKTEAQAGESGEQGESSSQTESASGLRTGAESVRPDGEDTLAQVQPLSERTGSSQPVSVPVDLNQAAELALRGLDLHQAQPVTIRAFNRRLLDGEAPVPRGTAAASTDDAAAAADSRPSFTREDPSRAKAASDLIEHSNARADARPGQAGPNTDATAESSHPSSRDLAARPTETLAAGVEAGRAQPSAAIGEIRSQTPQQPVAAPVVTTQVAQSARPASAGGAAPGSPAQALRSLLMTPAENGKPPKAEGKTEANSAQAELRRQLVAQVSRGLIAAVVKREGAEGGGSAMGAPETLVLKLRPESLGHVKVMLEWKEADSGQPQPRLFARFEVQSKHTQEVLRNAINELRSSLESRGLSLDGAQVELSKPVMADPLRALGERPESTAHSWHQPATDTQGGLADPSGGFSHSGGNSGDGRNGLAGGWAAGWSPVPSGALDSAIAMVPDLLDAEPGSAVFAAANRFGAFTGIDTFA